MASGRGENILFGKPVAIAAVGALALTTFSSAARPGASVAAASGGVVNVTWWNMWSGATVPITQRMVKQFNATHPRIRVTELTVPSADGDAKLLAAVAAGDPPDVFTEWNPTIGQYAHTRVIEPMNRYLKGRYAGLKKWYYPVLFHEGVYGGKLYGLSMSQGTLALYYNKKILKSAGISRPPKTLAQLDADQAKLWKLKGNRVIQMGFYPLTGSFDSFAPYFGVKAFNGTRYALAQSPRAKTEMSWLARYARYPYSAVTALDKAYGSVGGGSEDPFDMGKAAFWLSGAWEGYENIPPDNPKLVGHFGAEPFPTVRGGPSVPSTYVWGNYNVIPKGAKHPRAAFQFATWMAGYHNVGFISKILPEGGWVPVSPALAVARSYRAWLRRYPWVKPFVDELGSRYSQFTQVTPAESQYEQAATTALQEVATKRMTPARALRYIDAQANKALAKGRRR